MNNGAFGENFPYSNFHDLNMDWIIKIAKDFLDQYTHIQQIIGDGETSITNLTETGLAELQEKADNLENLLQQWYNTHSNDIANQLADALEDLSQSVVTNLSVFNQQAEEKIQELLATIPSNYSDLYNSVYENNSVNNFVSEGTDPTTWNGITYTWNGEICNVQGTASADSFIAVYSDSNALPGGIQPGDIVTLHIDSTDNNIKIRFYEYINNQWLDFGIINKTRQYVIKDTCTGLLVRIHVNNGDTVNGDIRLRLTRVQSNQDTNKAVPFILPDTGVDVGTIIEHALTKYGIAILGKGVYLTTGFTMPNYTTLRGAGRASIIRSFTSGDNGIVCGSGCTLEDFELDGLLTSYPEDEGNNNGITIIGNRDTTPFKYNTKINNVTIHGFGKAGIYIHETGTWVANSCSITNCEIYFCHWGIFASQYAEFNRITNVMCRNNYTGIYNLGGNNIYMNCSLSNNFVGFYIPESDNNDGHGAVIGCTINHSGNNTGYAIILRSISNGYIFDSCHIWYGKIISTDCSGITFTNCVFGGGTPDIEHWDNPLFLMNGCTFKQTPNLHGGHTEGNTDNFILRNCFMFNGTSVT